MPDSILLTCSARHAVLTLNQPEKRNPLPYLPEAGFFQALERLRKDPKVRAVVITGASPAFCSGLDLDALKNSQKASPAQHRADSKKIHAFFETIRNFPKPLIAAVNGAAVAGGAALALSCDIAVAAEDALFLFSEVRVGFVPALAGVYLARTVGERVARELLLTARVVAAQEAKALHLVHEVVPPTQNLLARAQELAEALAENSPVALRLTKELLNKSAELPLNKALLLAEKINAQARTTPDCKEGVRAFLEKRKAKWAGS